MPTAAAGLRCCCGPLGTYRKFSIILCSTALRPRSDSPPRTQGRAHTHRVKRIHHIIILNYATGGCRPTKFTADVRSVLGNFIQCKFGTLFFYPCGAIDISCIFLLCRRPLSVNSAGRDGRERTPRTPTAYRDRMAVHTSALKKGIHTAVFAN